METAHCKILRSSSGPRLSEGQGQINRKGCLQWGKPWLKLKLSYYVTQMYTCIQNRDGINYLKVQHVAIWPSVMERYKQYSRILNISYNIKYQGLNKQQSVQTVEQ